MAGFPTASQREKMTSKFQIEPVGAVLEGSSFDVIEGFLTVLGADGNSLTTFAPEFWSSIVEVSQDAKDAEAAPEVGIRYTADQ